MADFWRLVLSVTAATAVNAALLAALAFLSRSIITQLLAKDLEQFKGNLLEAAKEHEIRFSTLHAKRVEGLVELFGAHESLVTEAESAGGLLQRGVRQLPGIERLWDEHQTAQRLWSQYKLYLDAGLAARMRRIQRSAWEFLASAWLLAGLHPNTDLPEERIAGMLAWWEANGAELRRSLDQVETEFRAMLGSMKE